MCKIYCILIDYENIQPNAAELMKLFSLSQDQQQIIVFAFYNRSQIRLINELRKEIPHPNINFECIENRKKNTLDFAILLQIGYLMKCYPGACFLIISRDRDFDVVAEIVKERNVFISRWNSIEELLENERKTSYSRNVINYAKSYIGKLAKMCEARPKTEKALLNDLKSTFKKKLNEQAFVEILELLYQEKLIAQKNGRIVYNLKTVWPINLC